MDQESKFRDQERLSAQVYDYTYTEGSIEGWANAVPGFIENYKEELQSDLEKRVLDLGSGQGRNLVLLAEKGFNAYGIDVSESGLKAAKVELEKKGLKASLQLGSLFALPYKSDFFKAVMSNSSLQSLGGPDAAAQAFREASRVLKDNGLFFVYVNSEPLRESLRNQPNALGEHYYSDEFLKELAAKNNFLIDSIETEVVRAVKFKKDIRMCKVVFRKINNELPSTKES